MTKEEKYELARWAMNYALKKGADQSSISISESKSSTVDIREQKIETLREAIQSSMTIKLYADGRFSSNTTNRLNKDELSTVIKQAVQGMKYLSSDPHRKLPAASLYYTGEGGDLGLIDPDFERIEPETKIELASQVEAEAYKKDERVLSVSSGYYDYSGSRILMNSNGFEGDSGSSTFRLSASVSVDGGSARPSESWSERSVNFAGLKNTGIGTMAMQRALRKIGQAKIKSGKYDMVVENKSVSRLLTPIINALNGSNIQQKSSFLIDKIGQQVVSERLTLTDDPFVIGGIGSGYFDDEGLATKKRVIFDRGKLLTYYLNTFYAKKLDAEPTSGSTTNLVFETGDYDLDGLLKQMNRGIFITGFNGGNTNASTGDFSYGIDGFLIEKGAIIKPVSEMNISGNMKDLWSQLVEVGNDAYLQSNWQTPSLLFRNIDFSGL